MSAKVADPIEYSFVLQQQGINVSGLPIVNALLTQKINLHFTGNIACIACARQIKKTYNQGYCFPCVQKLAACDMCILKPQNCHYANGTCREPAWGAANCHIPHIVYLANSSGIKVGITKEKNLHSRWIDQGAIQALPIFRVQTRLQSGLIEHAIAKLIADKTDWRKMLRGGIPAVDLKSQRDAIFSELATTIQQIASKFKFGAIEILTAEPVHTLNYPVLQYPEKISTLCLDKQPSISDTLLGIKGQYLIFASGVINLRKYTGYEICVEF